MVDADYLRASVRGAIKSLGITQNAMARSMRISNSHLSRFLAGEKEPGDKILGWMGYRAVTQYEKLPPTLPRNNRFA